jgi:type III secretion inner rod protein HrpB2
MTTMIDPISSVSGVSGVGGVAAASVAGAATGPSSGAALQGMAPHNPPELQGLHDKFNRAMLLEPDPKIYSEQHLATSASPASAFVAQQEAVMRHTFDEVRRFSVEAPHMGVQDLAARHMELTYQMALVQVQFNAGVHMAQSSKSGLQTLMKNQ